MALLGGGLTRLVSLLLVNVFAATVGAQPSKENFYTQAERMVIHLERATASGGYVPVGTGFFVRNEKNDIFVVTARHVAGIGADLRARVPTSLVSDGKTDVVELKLPSAAWIYHPNNGDGKTLAVDVAVMKIRGVKDRSITTFRYCAIDCPKDEYNQLADDPLPPDQIVIFGFPEDLGFTLKEQRPMTRLGVVSLTADEEFILIDQANGTQKLLPKGAYLIDARMFPGNSGGPIVVYNPLSPIKLGGLVTAANRNLDYGIVTPVSQIAQTIVEARDAQPNGDWFALQESPKK